MIEIILCNFNILYNNSSGAKRLEEASKSLLHISNFVTCNRVLKFYDMESLFHLRGYRPIMDESIARTKTSQRAAVAARTWAQPCRRSSVGLAPK